MIAAAPTPSVPPMAEASASAPGAAAPTDPGRAATLPAAAGAAVASALQIGELQAQAQGNQSAVNLRFKVGGDNLSVRVALQAGEVHAQFNTDSGELRTALASAWPSVATAPGAPRFADPVFAAGTSGGSGTATDLGGGGRQGFRQPAPPDEDLGRGASPVGAMVAAGDSGAVPAAAAPIVAPAAPTGPRLQTFA